MMLKVLSDQIIFQIKRKREDKDQTAEETIATNSKMVVLSSSRSIITLKLNGQRTSLVVQC